jgi:PKD repeat protein
VSDNVPPVASSTSTCSGLTCSFNATGSSDPDGTIASYSWTFGDAAAGSGVTATHTYAAGGTYTVTLNVTDDGGKTSQTVSVIKVNAPPVASFTFYCSGLMRCFDAHGSRDPDGTIVSYAWSFGDGTTGSGVMAHHTYAAGGTYTVTLIVTDDGGATSQTVGIFNVNAPPVAAFTSTCIGLTCSFDAGGSSDPDGPIASYAWSFGDGTTGSGVAANRTYSQSGTFMVILIVTDNAAATSQTTGILNVRNAPPVASYTFACSGLTCSFNASGSSDPGGTIASYAWYFGDATTGSGVTPTHTYVAGGTYAVILIVTDNSGATNTHFQIVTVVVPPDMHVGDLDRASTSQSTKWTAIVTMTVHDSNHGPVANAAVSGYWNNGSTGSCTTNASGQCTVSRSGILNTKTSVSFTVANVARATLVYRPAENHDPDSDSNGTTVTVTRQ